MAAIGGVVLVVLMNENRGSAIAVLQGVPWVVPFVLLVLVVLTFLLSRTRLGRYIYAVGANPEAARRAGINVAMIRTVTSRCAASAAGLAGLVYASQLGSIATDYDGGTQVLFAVAAAVIGGCSLFGGRGKPVHALLGGLVIAVVINGLALMSVNAAVNDMATAVVLLAAVMLDALVRRRSSTPAELRVHAREAFVPLRGKNDAVHSSGGFRQPLTGPLEAVPRVSAPTAASTAGKNRSSGIRCGVSPARRSSSRRCAPARAIAKPMPAASSSSSAAAQREHSGVVDVGHAERVEHERARRSARALRRSRRAAASRKWIAFAYQSGVANSTTSTPRTGAACSGARQRRPARRARDAAQHVQLRAGADPRAIEDRERHGHADALLDARAARPSSA